MATQGPFNGPGEQKYQLVGLCKESMGMLVVGKLGIAVVDIHQMFIVPSEHSCSL